MGSELKMEHRQNNEHPLLVQTTVVDEATGNPIYTLIKLPVGTTIESLATILKKEDEGQAIRRSVVALNDAAPHSSSDEEGVIDDEPDRLEIVMEGHDEDAAMAADDEASPDDETSRDDATSRDDETSRDNEPRCSGSSREASSSEDMPGPSNLAGGDLPTPPSSPTSSEFDAALGGGPTFLAMISEAARAGCHNGHKAAILGGRYVLQKTNSRARLTGPFYCNACGLKFDWHSSARMHLNFHNRDYEACDKCTKRPLLITLQDGATVQPLTGQTGPQEQTGRPPKCTQCDRAFYRWSTYLAHQEKHKDKVKCPLCCKFFQSMHNVGRHYYDEHSGVQITCEICGNGYRAFPQYQLHMETLHVAEDRRIAAVPADDNSVNYSIDLPTLQQLDPSIRVFSSVERTCPVPNCGRIFSTQHTMQRHIYDLHTNELLPCNLCGNAYRTYAQYERHCERFHGENFRIEMPVGEISLPQKRKREAAVTETTEFMNSTVHFSRLPKAKRTRTAVAPAAATTAATSTVPSSTFSFTFTPPITSTITAPSMALSAQSLIPQTTPLVPPTLVPPTSSIARSSAPFMPFPFIPPTSTLIPVTSTNLSPPLSTSLIPPAVAIINSSTSLMQTSPSLTPMTTSMMPIKPSIIPSTPSLINSSSVLINPTAALTSPHPSLMNLSSLMGMPPSLTQSPSSLTNAMPSPLNTPLTSTPNKPHPASLINPVTSSPINPRSLSLKTETTSSLMNAPISSHLPPVTSTVAAASGPRLSLSSLVTTSNTVPIRQPEMRRITDQGTRVHRPLFVENEPGRVLPPPLDEPLDMTVVKEEPREDIILPD